MYCTKINLYEGREDVTLTTYVIEDSMEILKGGSRPAILICPGGANLFVSDREAESVALRFAGMGFHAFVVRYSVYMGGDFRKIFGPGPHETDPRSLFPNPTRDVAAAFLEIRKHSAEWHVDMNKVAVCGFSAGGHNALMYSVYWDKPIIYNYFGVRPEDLKPAAAVIGYGYGDYNKMRPNLDGKGTPVKFDSPAGPSDENVIDISYFGTSFPTSEMMEQASPAKMVSDNTPPIFLWTTCGDHTVPPVQTMYMGIAMAEAGRPYEIHIFENGDHGLALADESAAANRSQVNPEVAQWPELAGNFLKRHMPIDIPEA